MDDPRRLRRHLYEQYGRLPARAVRGRRGLRRQIALVQALPGGRQDGLGGVREPRRPLPPSSGPGRTV